MFTSFRTYRSKTKYVLREAAEKRAKQAQRYRLPRAPTLARGRPTYNRFDRVVGTVPQRGARTPVVTDSERATLGTLRNSRGLK